MTAQQPLIQLPDGSRAILEAAALLNEPFSVPLLIDLGVSADALDPLFDNAIFRESFPNRAEFTNSELRNGLLGQMAWSRKRHLCEQVGELLAMMAKHDEARARVDSSLQLALSRPSYAGRHSLAALGGPSGFQS